MRFWGRSIDTFEAAMKMLCSNKSMMDNIDCVSGRAFALCRDDINRLFSCTISDTIAVKNINKYCGDIFEIVSPVGWNSPFVMCVNNFIGMPTIIRNYFPYGHYIQCTIKENLVIANDPDGFPCLSFCVDDCALEKQQVIVTRDSTKISNIDYYQVLSDMFNLTQEVIVSCEEPNRIFLQYAIRNYLCQTAKAVRLLQETVGFTEANRMKFINLFSGMLSQTSKSVEMISKIDKQIWLLMEDIWNSKK
jgi:hypothetical protein